MSVAVTEMYMASQTATTITRNDTESNLSPDVLKHIEPIADGWGNGVGRRLYRIATQAGSNPPVSVFTKYTREVDDDTGDLVEVETIESVGHLQPRNLNINDRDMKAQMNEDQEDGYGYDEADIDLMVNTFTNWAEDYLQTRADTMEDADIHLLKEIRIGCDTDVVTDTLSRRGEFSSAEWDAFLFALSEATTIVDRVQTNDDFNSRYAFAFMPEFVPVPDWRLSAVEHRTLGVMQSEPLSNVAALLYADAVGRTQSEIADELNKDESTISQQVQKVKRLVSGAEWTTDRLS